MDPLIIHTRGGGRLDPQTSEVYVKSVATQMACAEHAVIHLHGGLVPASSAVKLAKRLTSYYTANKLVPVVFAWETGAFATILNNLGRIAQDPIFKGLIKKLLRHVAGKVLMDLPGGMGPGDQCQLPDPPEANKEYRKLETNEEPYSGKRGTVNNDTTDAERAALMRELELDADFTRTVDAIGRQNESTLLSEDIRKELEKSAPPPGSQSLTLVGVTEIVIKAGRVLGRVISRFRTERDHGIYPTIVEEVLREFYIDSIGTLVWGSMKNDARDNFANPSGEKSSGGWLLLRELAAAIEERKKAGLSLPKISVVGHSAGTIFASEMLGHLRREHPQITLHHLIFLAPAVRYDLFAGVLDIHHQQPLWDKFRCYALKDSLESGYWEVPGLYPRSLLYLVSGLLETQGTNGAFDMPLVGMERYFVRSTVYQDPEVQKVRHFFQSDPTHHVWSVVSSGPGRSADSLKHGAFDETDPANENPVRTMTSVVEFLLT